MVTRNREVVDSAKLKKLADYNEAEFRELLIDILIESLDFFHKGMHGEHLGLDVYAFPEYLHTREPDVVYSAKCAFATLMPSTKKKICLAANDLARDLRVLNEFELL